MFEKCKEKLFKLLAFIHLLRNQAVTFGKLVLKEFPESLLRRFKREGVDNPLLCSLLDQQLGKDADREVET